MLIYIGKETLARHRQTKSNLQLENAFPAEYEVSEAVNVF